MILMILTLIKLQLSISTLYLKACLAPTQALDVGCGSGRWTKYLSQKVGVVDAVDPSDAIYAADELLKSSPNIRLTKATTEALPFDNTYDLVVSLSAYYTIFRIHWVL